MATPFKMKGSKFYGYGNQSPLPKKEKTVTKTQTLQKRTMHPGDAVFEGSETSPKDQRITSNTLYSENGKIKEGTLTSKTYTHYPASIGDDTKSTVKGGKTIFGGDKTVSLQKRGGADIIGGGGGLVNKKITKSRRGGGKKKTVEFITGFGDKTTKEVTKYRKDGSVKSSKRKKVRTTKKRTSHSKKNQRLVDKAKTTYIGESDFLPNRQAR